MADFRHDKADFRPVMADFRPESANLKPQRVDFRTDRTKIMPERADLMEGNKWTDTDGGLDRHIKFPLFSTGLVLQDFIACKQLL